MKIYKALRQKNTLASKLKKIDLVIANSNSTIKGNQRRFDIKDYLNQRDVLVKQLIDLKVKLSTASLPILNLIYELSELKAKLVMLSKIDTKEGVQYNYSDTPAEYEVVFDEAIIKRIADNISEKINIIQDTIEEFNYNTEI